MEPTSIYLKLDPKVVKLIDEKIEPMGITVSGIRVTPSSLDKVKRIARSRYIRSLINSDLGIQVNALEKKKSSLLFSSIEELKQRISKARSKDHNFKISGKLRYIVKLRMSGLSHREISAKLKENGLDITHETVRNYITRLKTKLDQLGV